MTNHSPEIALVTGSNRGLGKSTVLNLAKKRVGLPAWAILTEFMRQPERLKHLHQQL